MTTLIIPCGGKSSRFPNMKPKWMLTHPDGKLMLQKAVEEIDLTKFTRFVITLIKQHDQQYDAALIVKQAFKYLEAVTSTPNIEICILDGFTSSASETIYRTLKQMNIQGSFVVKDSDNYVSFDLGDGNFIVGCGIDEFNLTNLQGKSYLSVDTPTNTIQRIVEKQIVSSTVCLGVYGFSSSKIFINAYEQLVDKYTQKEMYVSAVVDFLIAAGFKFKYCHARDYNDWGTLVEWKKEQERFTTIFTDFDGVLIKNSGKLGKLNWDNNDQMLEDNCKRLLELQKQGAQIVVTTARSEEYRETIMQLLNKRGIVPHAIVTGLNHAPRILINDFAPTNPYPSAKAINLKRNGDLKDYI